MPGSRRTRNSSSCDNINCVRKVFADVFGQHSRCLANLVEQCRRLYIINTISFDTNPPKLYLETIQICSFLLLYLYLAFTHLPLLRSRSLIRMNPIHELSRHLTYSRAVILFLTVQRTHFLEPRALSEQPGAPFNQSRF